MEPSPIKEIQECSHTYISDILRVQEKGTQMSMSECHQSFRLMHNMI
jgi:hypothetical protein